MTDPASARATHGAGPILSLADIRAGYGPLVILDDLSLSLARDEVLLILGANGSGKSTVLKTVMGLTRVTAGTIVFDDQPMTYSPPHRRATAGVGYVPQTGNVFAGLTVRENLRMGAFLRKDGFHSALPAVIDLFPRLGERLGADAADLSGGERRMLSIGLTLLAEPKILLLDEPSSDLAPAMVDIVYAAIDRIHREHNIPVLLVEQNIAKGLAIADRVIVMARGRTVAAMPAADVRSSDLHALFLDSRVVTTGPSLEKT